MLSLGEARFDSAETGCIDSVSVNMFAPYKTSVASICTCLPVRKRPVLVLRMIMIGEGLFVRPSGLSGPYRLP